MLKVQLFQGHIIRHGGKIGNPTEKRFIYFINTTPLHVSVAHGLVEV